MEEDTLHGGASGTGTLHAALLQLVLLVQHWMDQLLHLLGTAVSLLCHGDTLGVPHPQTHLHDADLAVQLLQCPVEMVHGVSKLLRVLSQRHQPHLLLQPSHLQLCRTKPR